VVQSTKQNIPYYLSNSPENSDILYKPRSNTSCSLECTPALYGQHIVWVWTFQHWFCIHL